MTEFVGEVAHAIQGFGQCSGSAVVNKISGTIWQTYYGGRKESYATVVPTALVMWLVLLCDQTYTWIVQPSLWLNHLAHSTRSST